MALEIERRFLVRSDAWRSSAGPAQPLRQGYLAASADGVTVRMLSLIHISEPTRPY